MGDIVAVLTDLRGDQEFAARLFMATSGEAETAILRQIIIRYLVTRGVEPHLVGIIAQAYMIGWLHACAEMASQWKRVR